MESRGPQINHLSFADDIIIISSTTRETLTRYEKLSDQPINKDKSHFMVTENTPLAMTELIKEITGLTQKISPITYLGCPLYIGDQSIIYYSELVAKVKQKITGWQSRMLSFGVKATMIKHVLHYFPIHTMPAISLPNTTINYMKRDIADFFWCWDKEKKKYH